MGGKSKQAQRTKNNSRPSSSGRSAELLGASIPTFVGFTTHADFGFVPMTPGFSVTDATPEAFDVNVSSEYQVLLRKMSKKDPVTKVKALQEFAELISKTDSDTVKSVLPWWPKLYVSLANDTEHRVREATQTAHNSIATKAGKNIAPYLKQLAPVWISSQYDNYAPAASVATNSFQGVFSARKIREVFLFCQNEILDYVHKNLIVHSMQTLCNPKTHTNEEAESKYNRTIACSLQTYTSYFENVEKEQMQANSEKNLSLLENPKFWSYSKQKSPNIRSAWFQTISGALQHAPFLLEKCKDQTISTIFKYMDENDPIVLMHAWTCMLVIPKVFPDWHTIISFDKSIRPKLFTILKNNGHGNAKIVYPNLLPFISNLSTDVVQNRENFFRDFFQIIRDSITSCTDGLYVKSNMSTIISSFYECVRYVVQNKSQESKTESEKMKGFAESVIQYYVVDIVKHSIFSDAPISKFVFLHVSALISYWTQNSSSSELFSELVRQFWSNFQREISENFQNGQITSEQSMKIVDFIQFLFNATPKVHETKVKFSTVDDKDPGGGHITKNKQQEVILQRDLKALCCTLSKIYIDKCKRAEESSHATELKTLCGLFNNPEFYKDLVNDSNLTTLISTLMGFLEKENLEHASIVDIVFDILLFVEKTTLLEYINKLLKVNNNLVIQMVLQRILSYPLCLEPQIKVVLEQDFVCNIILEMAKGVVVEDSKEKLNLLHKCFFQTDSGEILISQKTVDGIIKIMSEPFKNPNLINMLDTCGSFIAQIMPVICSGNATKEMLNEVFLKLFEFSICRTESDDLSEDTLWEITTCWQDVLSSGDIVMDDQLTRNCRSIILDRVADLSISLEQLNSMADMISKLITCSTEKNKDKSERAKEIDELIEVLLNESIVGNGDTKGTMSLIKYCAYFEYMSDILPAENLDHHTNDISPSDIHIYFKQSYLHFLSLFKLTCNEEKNIEKVAKEAEDADEENTEDFYDPSENLLESWSKAVYDHVLSAMLTSSVGESLITNSTSIPTETETFILALTEKVKLLLQNTDESTIDVLKDKLYLNICDDSSYWCRAALLLNLEKTDASAREVYDDLKNFVLTKNNVKSYVNVSRIFLPFLPSRNLKVFDRSEISNLLINIEISRCLIENYFSGSFNEKEDRNIVENSLALLEECGRRLEDNKLISKKNVLDLPEEELFFTIEAANLMNAILKYFPAALETKHFDIIIINLCSLVLNVNNIAEKFTKPMASVFITVIFKLHRTLCNFVSVEKTKSSTRDLSKVINDWDKLFAKEVNLLLLNAYMSIVRNLDNENNSYHCKLLDVTGPCVEQLDYSPHFNECDIAGLKITVDEVLKFGLDNLCNSYTSVRITSLVLIHRLIKLYVKNDFVVLETRFAEQSQRVENVNNDWNFLNKFTTHHLKYASAIEPYSEDFTFKLTELPTLKAIDGQEVFPYLYLWNCIIYACSQAPPELKPIYASWIAENNMENSLLYFLFRSMPVEILKNHDSKLMNNDLFKPLDLEAIKDPQLTFEQYVCHMYTLTLKHLPALARKWWSTAHPRQKTFVDKLTTNFVSSYICHEELRAISEKREKYENMQVTVHSSTREVIATYSIDEAKMELVINLAMNHPLGPVKVDSRKQIGGRLQSRTVVMQLTIFLTHQNGSIFDGLLLWKRNLDKKFEGVEECYICYSVIHQDTCQLPKSSCRACKKKFHGPCLYKWFTTSSKSTCPICRNIF